MVGTIEKVSRPRHRAAEAARPRCQSVPFAHREFHGFLGPACLDAEGKLVAKGQLGGTVSIEDGQLWRRAPARSISWRSSRRRWAISTRSPAWCGFWRLHQFRAGLRRWPQGDERRLRPDGRGVRRQGPACAHHCRRFGASARRCGRGRGGVRSSLIRPYARLADRAPDRPSRPPRRRLRRDREHDVGLSRRHRRRLRHRMRPAD